MEDLRNIANWLSLDHLPDFISIQSFVLDESMSKLPKTVSKGAIADRRELTLCNSSCFSFSSLVTLSSLFCISLPRASVH